MVDAAIAKIKALQPKERGAVWMVCEQLMDMVRSEPTIAEIIAQDMDVKELHPAECEKKIKAFADKHKSRNFACVTPDESDRIIREFYGLPERTVPTAKTTAALPNGGSVVVNLADFLGV